MPRRPRTESDTEECPTARKSLKQTQENDATSSRMLNL